MQTKRLAALAAAIAMLASSALAQTTLETYSDAENGVSFSYASSVWHPLDADKDTDYLRPSIQPTRAVFVYGAEKPPYEGTDFTGLAFNYAIAPVKTAAACAAAITQYGDAAPGAPVTVNGVHFNFAQGGDAAMNHQLFERLYSTFANGRCYVFDLALSTAGFGVSDDVRQMNEAERTDANQALDSIFGTVKIAKLK